MIRVTVMRRMMSLAAVMPAAALLENFLVGPTTHAREAAHVIGDVTERMSVIEHGGPRFVFRPNDYLDISKFSRKEGKEFYFPAAIDRLKSQMTPWASDLQTQVLQYLEGASGRPTWHAYIVFGRPLKPLVYTGVAKASSVEPKSISAIRSPAPYYSNRGTWMVEDRCATARSPRRPVWI
jgi:hypothetical protein